MSLDPPTYLGSLQSNIRQRPIPWDGAVRAGTLTEEQYSKIRAVDKAKKPEARKEIVSGDLDGYRVLFVGGSGKSSVLETAGKHANVIQYILVLLGDLLEGKSTTVPSHIHMWDGCHGCIDYLWQLPSRPQAHDANISSYPRCPVPCQSHLQDPRSLSTFLTSAKLDQR